MEIVLLSGLLMELVTIWSTHFGALPTHNSTVSHPQFTKTDGTNPVGQDFTWLELDSQTHESSLSPSIPTTSTLVSEILI